jgi:hypothetical protein
VECLLKRLQILNGMKSSEMTKAADPCHTLTASQTAHYLFVYERRKERHVFNTVKGEVFLITNVSTHTCQSQ